MPTIKDSNGDEIVISGRTGIQYTDRNGNVYFIDSEMVISNDYNIAIYENCIESLYGAPNLSDKEMKLVIEKVIQLCDQGGIRTKKF